MRNIKNFAVIVLLLFLFGAGTLYPQQRYPLGAIFDEAAYSRLPRKAALASRAYEGLPKSYSLKQYAPLPGDQIDYGTCVAWASAYAARTISESVALGRKDQTDTTRNAFSPVYVYRSIRPDDPECRQGAQIFWALDLMKDSGAVKMLDIERTVAFPRVDLSQYRESRKYPIADYVTLFSRNDKSKPGLVVRTIKKSLVEGKPVIIGMNTPPSFMEADSVWQPVESSGFFYGGHAMCVVGYDDEKNGGVFEVINSWGRKWGNGGFMWIPYAAFVDFTMEGYEMIENLAVYSEAVKFAGSVQVEIVSESGVRSAPLVSMSGAFYKTADPLGEGTRFRFAAASGESAYVYAFAASQAPDTAAGPGDFFSPVLLFPQAGVSPLLNYQDSAITMPGEDHVLVLDAAPGTEYLFILYAKQALDIRTIMRRFESAEGTPAERLSAAAGPNLLKADAVRYGEENAAFTAETDDSRAVAALVVAIDHR
ncbi:MAG: C1 family peptidase [Treponema sp.]|jgi:C1A family cysteine protease|nr:C1 family peptidase [Treponema sp.]